MRMNVVRTASALSISRPHSPLRLIAVVVGPSAVVVGVAIGGIRREELLAVRHAFWGTATSGRTPPVSSSPSALLARPRMASALASREDLVLLQLCPRTSDVPPMMEPESELAVRPQSGNDATFSRGRSLGRRRDGLPSSLLLHHLGSGAHCFSHVDINNLIY